MRGVLCFEGVLEKNRDGSGPLSPLSSVDTSTSGVPPPRTHVPPTRPFCLKSNYISPRKRRVRFNPTDFSFLERVTTTRSPQRVHLPTVVLSELRSSKDLLGGGGRLCMSVCTCKCLGTSSPGPSPTLRGMERSLVTLVGPIRRNQRHGGGQCARTKRRTRLSHRYYFGARVPARGRSRQASSRTRDIVAAKTPGQSPTDLASSWTPGLSQDLHWGVGIPRRFGPDVSLSDLTLLVPLECSEAWSDPHNTGFTKPWDTYLAPAQDRTVSSLIRSAPGLGSPRPGLFPLWEGSLFRPLPALVLPRPQPRRRCGA